MRRISAILLCALLLLPLACAKRKPTEIGIATEPVADPIAIETAKIPEPSDATPDVTSAPQIGTTGEDPAETPEAERTETPQTQAYSALPIECKIDWEQKEGELIRFDIDSDGREETISYRMDVENDDTIILIDEKEVLFDFSAQLTEVILIDLDPETPWVNLLVEIDFASDDYVTTEVHLVNGEPVKGVRTEGVSVDENGRVVVYFRTEFLGTRSCSCTCSGEALTPDTVWLDCWYPSEQEIAESFDELVEFYELQIAKRDVPCTVDGKEAKIPKDSYVYLRRINLQEKLAEICTVDGITAIVAFTEDEESWRYLIDGVSQDEYFDNILYAD